MSRTNLVLRSGDAVFVALLAIIATGTLFGQAPSVSFTTYPGVPGLKFTGITAGSDGAVWFSGYSSGLNMIGRINNSGIITQYLVSSPPYGITAGPDGALWFTEPSGHQIGKITTGGQLTEYSVSCCSPLSRITTGPDGALWFTGGGRIGRITTDGMATDFPLPGSSTADGITTGPDGALWFAEPGAVIIDEGPICAGTEKIGRMTTTGTVLEYPLPYAGIWTGAACTTVQSIVAGPDGQFWFNTAGDTRIGQVTTAGLVAEHSLPSAQFDPKILTSITAGPDGALWFLTFNTDQDGVLWRITTTGGLTNYNLPVQIANSLIAKGADGALWFTANGGGIVRAALNAGPIITTTSVPPATPGTAYSTTLLAQGGTPPYLWSVIGSNLPMGLNLNSFTGVISGTPTGSGTSFTVQAADSSVPAQLATQGLTLTISNSSSSFSIASSPNGLAISVDGVSYTAPQTFACNPGSQHTITANSPQPISVFPGSRYLFAGWGDGVSAASRQITCLSATTAYTANFNTQYLLTTSVAPPGAGSIIVNPPSSDGFYNSGATVQLTAIGGLLNWSGDLSGSANPQSVIMNGSKSVTANFAIVQLPQVALQFVPVTPCRILDTRNAGGPLGGPYLAGGTTRTLPVLSSACGIPASAAAYAVNITVVPRGPSLGYLAVWPAGRLQPLVSTLNSPDGSVLANAAIVPAGTAGGINVFATDPTELIVDINGYFTPPATGTLQFYPLRPCRVLDTRNPTGAFGGPSIPGGSMRSFAIRSSSCGVPSTAAAYSFNVTAVPHGSLGYLTAWAAGQPQPLVSTLNSLDGTVLANAAIVPAGSGGDVSFFAADTTDLVVDINGYFAPPGLAGLNFYVVSPCRVVDTRNAIGPLGGPILSASTARTFSLPAGACGLSSVAAAYSLNITVQPAEPLGFLTAWPTGQTQPLVSTLNATKGLVVANAALLPAGTGGSVDVFVTNTTHVIIDANGYFGQ